MNPCPKTALPEEIFGYEFTMSRYKFYWNPLQMVSEKEKPS